MNKTSLTFVYDQEDKNLNSINKSQYVSELLRSHLSGQLEITFADYRSDLSSLKSENIILHYEDTSNINKLLNWDLSGKYCFWIHDIYKRGKENNKEDFLRIFQSAKKIIFSSYRNLLEAKQILATAKLEATIPLIYLPYPVIIKEQKLASLTPQVILHSTSLVEDHAHVLLDALRGFTKGVRVVWMVDDRELIRAKELVSEFSLDNISVVGGRSFQKWQELSQVSDIACHLRVSAYGDILPYLNISMSCGLDIIVNDFAEGSYLPNTVVNKIPAGVEERQNLIDCFNNILTNKQNPLNTKTKTYAEENFDINLISAEFLKIIK